MIAHRNGVKASQKPSEQPMPGTPLRQHGAQAHETAMFHRNFRPERNDPKKRVASSRQNAS